MGKSRKPKTRLDPDRVIATIERLSNRIIERFPDANLVSACNELLRLSRESRSRAIWLAKPIIGLRIFAAIAIALLISSLIAALGFLDIPDQSLNIVQFFTLMNTGMNNVVLLAAVVFFLVSIEGRVKRRRALLAFHELRSLAHIIDMHQLTKDPDRVLFDGADTKSSPSNEMGVFEMGRYLDYCGEMFSLIGKIAAIYGAHLQDEIAISAASEVERLSTGLSQKIFQKIMILHGLLSVPRNHHLEDSG